MCPAITEPCVVVFDLWILGLNRLTQRNSEMVDASSDQDLGSGQTGTSVMVWNICHLGFITMHLLGLYSAVTLSRFQTSSFFWGGGVGGRRSSASERKRSSTSFFTV